MDLMVNRDRVFEIGSQAAALTYGHPSGHLSAGFMALLIHEIMSGAALIDSIRTTKQELIAHSNHQEVLEAVEKAELLAGSGRANRGVETLGEGWVAEEALAIALYCSLVTPNFEEAFVLAVNHFADSDSTWAIAWNICEALYGDAVIPFALPSHCLCSRQITPGSSRNAVR